MAKQVDSALAQAVTDFDEQLASFSRLAELFLKTPLTSVKHVERANLTLGEIADAEQRLQQAGQAMLRALTEARTRQEQLSKDVIAHAPVVGERNAALRDLLTAMAALATDVAALHDSVQQGGDVREAAQTADAGDISARVLALSSRAEELAKIAHDREFAEVATQAHTLHQRLSAIGKKLLRATSN